MKHSKEGLEGMSDLQLNTVLCEYIPVIIEDDQSKYIQSGDSAVMVNDIVDMYKLDFCNNPSDIMPLVFKVRLFVIPHSLNLWRVSTPFVGGLGFSSIHKNPLRAAAIVYILIKQ